MKIYRVELVISGINGAPEMRIERLICADWQEVCGLMASICRDTGCVIRSMLITETADRPFDYKTVKSSDIPLG